MKILVTVTEVATVDGEFKIDGLTVDERHLDFELNEWDNYAIEEAVQLAESTEDAEVVTVTIGPERTDETIRMALAKGADRAIRIWDDELEAAAFLDPRTKARLLASVVEAEAPELVLSGVQSGDDANGATGVALAARSGLAWGAVVVGLKVDDDTANIDRELEGGVVAHGEVELPALFTIQTGINEPSYASLRGIRQAGSKPLETRSLDDLGLALDVLTSTVQPTAMSVPQVGGDVTLWEGDAAATAEQLATFLRERGVIEA